MGGRGCYAGKVIFAARVPYQKNIWYNEVTDSAMRSAWLNHYAVKERRPAQKKEKDFMYDNLDFDMVFNNLEVGVWVTNASGGILYTNHTYRQIRELPKEWFDSHNAFQDYNDGIISVSPTKIVCETKQPVHLVQNICDAEGNTTMRLFIMCRPIFDANGNVEYVVGQSVPVEQISDMYLGAMQEGKEYSLFSPPDRKTEEVVAQSDAMQEVIRSAQEIADTNSTVLISGESGVGKNVIANYIHDHSPRFEKNIVEINCAALPESLLEAELFGYEPGAFTNALSKGKEGLFDAADGGTLFLDEINSMPLSLQGKLLRAIETKCIRRVGGTKDIPVDFRLITASNSNLKKCV